MKKKIYLSFVILSVAFSFVIATKGFADYGDQLERQAEQLLKRFPSGLDETYFRDMGIIAHKADSAQSNEMTAKLVRTYMLEQMDKHINQKLKDINNLYFSDSYKASAELEEFAKFQKYFEPSQDFLMTGEGRAIQSEIGQLRKGALEKSKTADSKESVLALLEAVRKTGLFLTNSDEERVQMRDLTQELECGIGWKSKINYRRLHKFKTDYDEGTIDEEVHLNLQSSGKNLNEAKWVGEWIYHLKGRDGTAEATSQATLTYQRGKDIVDLAITYAKINSIGRMNMPIPAAGDHRTFEMKGDPLRPQAIFTGDVTIDLAGCRENEITATVKKS